ncbi:TetR/AcrR family transcriptional regulator [Actinomadura rugatobispora]|uniref:TetR/AcrR family transcriptional regulator n=1 Tax=Actinomadura rugatobispora TaxID=1994 RepID=A0ABW1AF51_9ACTN|nr:TetR/AcrR family transcriptional regulator [Actinomadura rugatobispora]
MGTSRRQEILDAALEMFAERGYRGTSLDAIAERVGLTRQGVLHYFPSKKKLLAAVLELRDEASREALTADRPVGEWPVQLAEVVAYDRANAGLAQVYSVLVAESVTEGHPAQEYFRDYYERVRARTVRRLAAQYGDRLPSGLSPEAVATALVAMIDGMQQQWLLDRERAGHPEIMRDVLSVLLGTAPR